MKIKFLPTYFCIYCKFFPFTFRKYRGINLFAPSVQKLFLLLDNLTLELQHTATALMKIFNKLALGMRGEEREVLQSKGILAVVAVSGEDFFTAVRLHRQTLQNGRVLNSKIKFEFLHLNILHRNCSSLHRIVSKHLITSL